MAIPITVVPVGSHALILAAAIRQNVLGSSRGNYYPIYDVMAAFIYHLSQESIEHGRQGTRQDAEAMRIIFSSSA